MEFINQKMPREYKAERTALKKNHESPWILVLSSLCNFYLLETQHSESMSEMSLAGHTPTAAPVGGALYRTCSHIGEGTFGYANQVLGPVRRLAFCCIPVDERAGGHGVVFALHRSVYLATDPRGQRVALKKIRMEKELEGVCDRALLFACLGWGGSRLPVAQEVGCPHGSCINAGGAHTVCMMCYILDSFHSRLSERSKYCVP